METRVTAMWRGKQYTVTRLACGYLWRMSSTTNPLNGQTLNYDQMINAGIPTGYEDESSTANEA
ncbi:hypothetical protein EV102420_06_00110 [Pseudescherichia vulneris NBRC 102420]|uniref:Uncharacterized protein n=1 Tax=Pseudescherichia vulneris NBRC 102420 TaxID=1115515 RepID=A0A090VPV9_PSEVU|nr:hypothetical protein EV102420_06_00110 [Pseudescherichia vulneris NBRC 102420]